MTRNLKIYIFFSIIWSILFFSILNYGVNDSENRWPIILAAAVTYGVGFWLVGYTLGKQDDQSKVRYSLEAAYIAASYIVSAIIGSLWIILFQREDIWKLAIFLPILIADSLFGYYQYKKSIKGMKSQELFR